MTGRWFQRKIPRQLPNNSFPSRTRSTMAYVDTQLFINGTWQEPAEGKTLPVMNPATGKEIGRVAHASRPDLERAVEAALKGFNIWRDMLPAERSKIMRKA